MLLCSPVVPHAMALSLSGQKPSRREQGSGMLLLTSVRGGAPGIHATAGLMPAWSHRTGMLLQGLLVHVPHEYGACPLHG